MRNLICTIVLSLFSIISMAQTNGGIFYDGTELPSSRIVGKSNNMATSMLTYGLIKAKCDMRIEGGHSITQIDNSQPTFEIIFNEEDERYGRLFSNEGNFGNLFLMKLKNGKNIRKLENGIASIFSSEGHISEKYMIPLDVEETGNGVFKVTPREELKKGEYAFWFNVKIPDGESADGEKPKTKLNYRVFDFSIVETTSSKSKSTPNKGSCAKVRG